nr:MAG TPA: hypothetical protein [Caudoviricetes sp.]
MSAVSASLLSYRDTPAIPHAVCRTLVGVI